jgi:diguanylate cyclase (GGDEF)-like protein
MDHLPVLDERAPAPGRRHLPAPVQRGALSTIEQRSASPATRASGSGRGEESPGLNVPTGQPIRQIMASERDLHVPYQLRTIRYGIVATVMALVGGIAMPVADPSKVRNPPLYAATLLATAVIVVVVALVPWRQLLSSSLGVRLLFMWAVVDVVVVTAGIAATGGGRSNFYLFYGPVMIYNAACLPGRRQLGLFIFTVGSYLMVLGLTGWSVSAGELIIRLVTLGLLVYISGFLAAELMRHMSAHGKARYESERLLEQERTTLEQLRRSEAQVTHQATHDALTGLANRALFRSRLEAALDQPDGAGTAVLFVDLDDFKTVNDSCGHAVGDELLIAVAARLTACVRSGDTVARLGGDEFALLLEDAGEATAVQTAERLTSTLGSPMTLASTRVTVRASIGIAVAPPGGCDAGEIIRNADVAMYAAKEGGKGRFAVFEARMHTSLLERIEQEHDLREAISRSQFVVRYQPVVELASGRLAGVEALVRWQHPTRGLVPPADFIPLAERSGLIIALGRFVLVEACRRASGWQATANLDLSVNLSARQLADPHLTPEVAAALSAARLPAERLVLEITETALLDSAAHQALASLRSLGVRLALDDFGTGYSSLEQLQRFPVDIIKIDKVFVDRVTSGLRESALTRAIVQIGHTMGLDTIAEGIETAEQAEVLQQLGCRYGQGYWFSKPLEAAELERLLDLPARTWRHDADRDAQPADRR